MKTEIIPAQNRPNPAAVQGYPQTLSHFEQRASMLLTLASWNQPGWTQSIAYAMRGDLAVCLNQCCFGDLRALETLRAMSPILAEVWDGLTLIDTQASLDAQGLMEDAKTISLIIETWTL